MRANGVLGAAALAVVFAAALARPAQAWEDAGFGGVQGWGGLYRENHDVGHSPLYIYDGPRYFWQPAAYVDDHRHGRAMRHVAVRHHAVTRHGARRPRPHRCTCGA